MLRIVYINANNSEIGGADLSLLKMAVAMKEEGAEPIVILRDRTHIVDLYEEHNIPVLILPIVRLRASVSRFTKFTYLYQLPMTVAILVRQIVRLRPDLVHTNDFIDGAGNLAAWLAGTPSVQHCRIIANRPRWLVTLLRVLSVFSTELICVSYAVRNQMVTQHSPNCRVLYDWLDMESAGHTNQFGSLHEELGLDSETRLVGVVGRLEWWKGQHIFLEAANLIAADYPKVGFLIVGGPTTDKEWYLEDLRRIHASLEFKDRIIFTGYRTDIANILDQLDVLVHTSIRPEPFGLVIMEALSRNVIVVASNDGGVPEQITHGESGFLYEPGNVEELTNALRTVLDNGEKQETIKIQALNIVDERFSKRKRVAELLTLYVSLLSKQQ